MLSRIKVFEGSRHLSFGGLTLSRHKCQWRVETNMMVHSSLLKKLYAEYSTWSV